MRERKPLEEIIYTIVEIALTLLMLVIFLFVLITHGEVVSLIDLLFVFGILMNVLAGAYSHYRGNRALAVLHFVIGVACFAVIIL